jgi:hypothetical protein
MAGDARDVGDPMIFMSIIFNRDAFWEPIWRKTLSPCAVDAIGKSISELSKGARDE